MRWSSTPTTLDHAQWSENSRTIRRILDCPIWFWTSTTILTLPRLEIRWPVWGEIGFLVCTCKLPAYNWASCKTALFGASFLMIGPVSPWSWSLLCFLQLQLFCLQWGRASRQRARLQNNPTASKAGLPCLRIRARPVVTAFQDPPLLDKRAKKHEHHLGGVLHHWFEIVFLLSLSLSISAAYRVQARKDIYIYTYICMHIHIYMCISIYAVELYLVQVWPFEGILSGPSLFLKDTACQRTPWEYGFQQHFRGYYLVQVCVFKTHPTWTR